MNRRFAIFGAQDPFSIEPRFDPLRRERRIDPNAPVTAAYLGGRPVVLAQLDPKTRPAGEPPGLTVPLTVSRFQHAMDIERGYDPRGWEPTPLVGFSGPGLRQIVDCCPWRLAKPRALSMYEWTVVERAIHESIAAARGGMFSAQTEAMAKTLTGTLAAQNQAPGWKQTSFGPAPAVATYLYGCLGSWWGALDPASQARALADMAATNLLRRKSPPWQSCPREQTDVHWRAGIKSEYQAQRGALGRPGVIADPCSNTRMRTSYLPVTGKQLLDIMTAVGGGQLDPQLQNMVKMGGALFEKRTFILGIEFKAQPDFNKMPSSLSTMADLMKIADAMLQEAALIWARGQGISIRQAIVSGQIDPAQLMRLVQAMAPEAAADWWQNLPQLLPGLDSLLQGAIPMDVTHELDVSRSFASPSTPPTTGLKVVDQPAAKQDTTPPDQPPAKAAATGPDPGVALAFAAVAIGGALIWRGWQTR